MKRINLLISYRNLKDIDIFPEENDEQLLLIFL